MTAVDRLRALTPEQPVRRLGELERQVNQLHAAQLQLISVMDEQDQSSSDRSAKDWTVEEIAAALRLSPTTAADRLEFARALRRMPRLLDLLRRGAVTMMHARLAARETLRLDCKQLDAVLDRVLPQSVEQTVGQFVRSVRRAVLAVAAEDAEQRRQRAMEDRRVAVRPTADGMAEWWALLPAERSAAVMARIEDEARREIPGDNRTIEQRRADAFVDLVLGGHSPVAGGLRPDVQILVAASTVAGLDDEPGELAGHGPISAALARTLAFDPTGTWRRMLTDDRGRLLDYGRRTFRPPARLARHVRARDRQCRFPGCPRPAQGAHLDHIKSWEDGGTTSAENLHVLCARHHHAKHEGGWKVRCRPDGTTVWTSPSGRTYEVRTATYPVGMIGATQSGPDPPEYARC